MDDDNTGTEARLRTVSADVDGLRRRVERLEHTAVVLLGAVTIFLLLVGAFLSLYTDTHSDDYQSSGRAEPTA